MSYLRKEGKKERGENDYFIPLALCHSILSVFNHQLWQDTTSTAGTTEEFNEAQNTSLTPPPQRGRPWQTVSLGERTNTKASRRVPIVNPVTHTTGNPIEPEHAGTASHSNGPSNRS